MTLEKTGDRTWKLTYASDFYDTFEFLPDGTIDYKQYYKDGDLLNGQSFNDADGAGAGYEKTSILKPAK
jgi:hypothetical protein